MNGHLSYQVGTKLLKPNLRDNFLFDLLWLIVIGIFYLVGLRGFHHQWSERTWSSLITEITNLMRPSLCIPFELTERGFNSLAPARCGRNLKLSISNQFQGEICWVFLRDRPQVSTTRPHYWIYSASGTGLMSSGNKALPEPVLAQIYVAICRH